MAFSADRPDPNSPRRAALYLRVQQAEEARAAVADERPAGKVSP